MTTNAMFRTIRWDAWALSEEADRRFRRIAGITLIPALLLILAARIWQQVETPPELPAFDTTQYVELLQDTPPPAPAPAPAPEQPVETPKPAPKEEPKPIEKPAEKAKPVVKPIETPAKPVPSARDVAAKSGILAMASALDDLRDKSADNATADGPLTSATITSKSGIGTTSAAAIAATASSGSGGIADVAGDVSSTQGGVGVGNRNTGRVQSSLGTGRSAPKGGPPGEGTGRTPSEIQAVFNKNQGPFYAIFNRAARSDASIGRGKIVVRLTIAPSGAVTSCTLVSSTYGSPDFERKVIERVKLINFGAKAVPVFTMDYPIQFIPQ